MIVNFQYLYINIKYIFLFHNIIILLIFKINLHIKNNFGFFFSRFSFIFGKERYIHV